MATVRKWSGVAVAVQSALAAADTIVSITKANPGVVTATAHGLNNGDWVVLDVLGMNEVDGRIYRVANKTTDTFELEGENTTSYNTFVSGTAEAITFGVTINTITDISASGGEYDFIDTTTIHETVRSQVPGPAAPATFSMQSIWDPGDTGLQALKAAADVQAVRAIRFTWPDGAKFLFNGYVGASLIPTGSAQDKVISPVTIVAHGRPTTYTT